MCSSIIYMQCPSFGIWMRIITSGNTLDSLLRLWTWSIKPRNFSRPSFFVDCSVFTFAWGDARAQHVPTRKRTATARSSAWLRAERGGLDGTPRKSWDATQAVSLHSLATLSCHGRRRLQSSGRFSVRQGDGEDGWVCKLFAAVSVGGLVICVARNATPTLSAPLLHCSYKEVYIYPCSYYK